MNRNRLTGSLLAFIGIAVLIMAKDLSAPVIEHDPGPRFFPSIAAAGLIICGLFISAQPQKRTEPFLTPEGWRRMGWMAVLLIGYTLGLIYLGFLIITPIALYITMRMMGQPKSKYLTTVVVSLAVTFIVHYVFQELLMVILPSGIW